MELTDAIKKRRAYRSIEPIDITPESIHDLAEHAGLAPSCYNKQPWRFVFVYGREMLEHIFTALSQGNDWAKKAAMIVAVSSRKDLDCLVKNREYYLFDTGMATAFLMLRATELNLVCHPIAGYDEEKVKTILAVPDDFTVITLLIVGKKSDTISPLLSEKMAESETKRPPRLQFSDYCFVDKYRAG